MGLKTEQFAKGRRIARDDQEYEVVGNPVNGDLIPVALTGDDATGVAGLLPAALLTDGETEWKAVEPVTDATDVPVPSADDVTIRKGDKTMTVSSATADVLASEGWERVE